MDKDKNNKGNTRTAFEVYLSVVFKWGNLMLVSAAMCASICFIMFQLLGLVDLNLVALTIFVIMDITYFIMAIIMIKTSFDEEGYLKKGRLQLGKLFTSFVIIVQWNYILYMAESRTFWGFMFFFMILISFYLDNKMVIIDGVICCVSLVISWFTIHNNLPVDDSLYIADLMLMIVGIVLSLVGIIVFIFFMKHFLVTAKKDELENNNKRVQSVLDTAQGLAENLLSAGDTLSQIMENESASSEELAATSENLLNNSNQLSLKSDESIVNLNELRKWGTQLNENVEKVSHASTALLHKSEENEKILDELKKLNKEVAESTEETSVVAGKLTNAVQKIDSTLQLINDISESTNLLALNASIEAARAGEAGKGFTVVATEVGNLANSTKESLDDVQSVIQRVRENVYDVTNSIENNTERLIRQKESFDRIFKGMHEMVALLRESINQIQLMKKAHQEQSNVIHNTIHISENIAESIHMENQEFTSISQMVENNADDIAQMAEQVMKLNDMVNKIDSLLNK